MGKITNYIFRNPSEQYSGKLKVQVINIIGLSGKRSDSNVSVHIRIDKIEKAVSKPRNKSWDDELVIEIEKATEVEISVHDQGLGILGMVWFPMTDLLQEISNEHSNNQNYLNCWLDLFPAGKINVQLVFGKLLLTSTRRN
jgi:hypothetical protein